MFRSIETKDNRHFKMKCQKCNCTGKKFVGQSSEIFLDDESNNNLTCEEIIIKNIIL